MKPLSTRLVLTLAAISSGVLGLGTLGCSSDNPTGTGNGDTKGAGGGGGGSNEGVCADSKISISFNPMYSAFIDGSSHTFQIPAVANGVSNAGVTWSASDKSMVQLDKDATGVTITTLKAGDVKIIASVGGMCGSADLKITEAMESQWQAGNARYNNMNPLPMVMTDANGIPINPTQIVIDPPDHPPACTNCHGDTATSSFFRTVSHTPMQTGGFNDTDLAGIFTMATVPPGGYFADMIIPKPLWGFFHKWNDITGDNVQGMVIYLRSLTPKSQGGSVDFGGFMRPGGMGAGGATSMGAGGSTTGSGGRASGAGGSGSGGDAGTGGAKAAGGSAGAAGASAGGRGGASGAAGAAGSAGKGGAGGTSTGGSAGSSGAAGAGGGNSVRFVTSGEARFRARDA